MLIVLPLLIITILTIFSIVLGATFVGTTAEQVIDNTAIVNGTAESFFVDTGEMAFSIDPIVGALLWITVLSGLAVAVGFRVIATGLSEESVRVVIMAVAYTTIWISMSALASPLIINIQTFGALIYVSLTLVYIIGVIQKISAR